MVCLFIFTTTLVRDLRTATEESVMIGTKHFLLFLFCVGSLTAISGCSDDDPDGDGIPSSHDCFPFTKEVKGGLGHDSNIYCCPVESDKYEAGCVPGTRKDGSDNTAVPVGNHSTGNNVSGNNTSGNNTSVPACSNPRTYFRDADGDSEGSLRDTSEASCTRPVGYVENSTDCNDSDRNINTHAAERCDNIDNNCNGQVDENAIDVSIFYFDGDDDGYGDPANSVIFCFQPLGYVRDNTDCDDEREDQYPGAPEYCNGVDNDCDGVIDEDPINPPIWYVDGDDDGYGDPLRPVPACQRPIGHVSNNFDCDDENENAHPELDELCNGFDDDCDGVIDLDAINRTEWYPNFDGDEFADSDLTKALLACEQPAGYLPIAFASDCDDTNPDVNPHAIEMCDGIDNNCDGADEDLTAMDTRLWYHDGDDDGYGDPDINETVLACEQPSGYLADTSDCNDENENIHPGHDELCDGLDNNCNDEIDEGAIDFTDFFFDGDDDGFGDPNDMVTTCNPPDHYIVNNTDCNGRRNDINPDAQEICGDGIDNDCDGVTDEDDAPIGSPTWWIDVDGDGYGNILGDVVSCNQPVGYVDNPDDCNDDAVTGPNVHPAMLEICDNAIDDNCDGEVDQPSTVYADTDGDSYGDPGNTVAACDVIPSGYVTNDLDCDDSDALVSPDGTEVCDSIDNDCNGIVDDDYAVDASTWYADADRDTFGDVNETTMSCQQPNGYVANDTDCNGFREDIHPGAIEICDTFDNDCDGVVDNDDAVNAPTWYQDRDNDGWGELASAFTSCQQLQDTIDRAGDCNDRDEDINPDALEVCDGDDNDCDGIVDNDDAVGAEVWYRDADADTYGDPNDSMTSCLQPQGFVGRKRDCDDTLASINPDAIELCDGVDNDCDREVDENSAADASTWFADNDGDTYGDPNVVLQACQQPNGYVARVGDCNDNNEMVNIGAAEFCGDRIDNDCDGEVDGPNGINALTFYLDADQDTFGDPNSPTVACALPAGYVSDSTDCNDRREDIFPGADEVCGDLIDNDCDSVVDEPDAQIASSTWYRDFDADGYGDIGESLLQCGQPVGYVANSEDCIDTDAQINPSAVEICNDGIDNNCDGDTDQPMIVYADVDGDTYGDPNVTDVACDTVPLGFVTNDRDCLDSDSTVNPEGNEVCDGIDNDCNGLVDDHSFDALTWYADIDGDTYGDPLNTLDACQAPLGYLADSSDCDDRNAAVNPSVVEICADNVDNNCDGQIDDDAPGASLWYVDNDGDGYGDASISKTACTQPVGFVSSDTDCNDQNNTVHPNGTEVCFNGLDDDCSGDADGSDAVNAITWYLDFDTDGHGDPNSSINSCTQPQGYVSVADDCDDNNPANQPGGIEVCDGADNNCDGVVDEDTAADASTWYVDGDLDGFGDATRTTVACNIPSGYVANATDCDDSNNTVYPGGVEICFNGLDDDCDGEVDGSNAVNALTWYRDRDEDTFGDLATNVKSCVQPVGYVNDSSDCNDREQNISPAAVEICNSIDDNCNGNIDEGAAIGATTWYADVDGDTYGDLSDSVEACMQPIGYVPRADDCDDTNPSVRPGVIELCNNGIDDNCDGQVDAPFTVYADTDSDNYGDINNTLDVCDTVPANYVLNSLDCDDTTATVSPAVVEICDFIDNDCDGTVDEPDAQDATVWYEDRDSDSFGDPLSTRTSCPPLPGYVLNGQDCDDFNNSINPGVIEICGDNIDNDCDGVQDDNGIGATTWFADRDGDTFGDVTATKMACSQPTDYVPDNSDCDDRNALVNPGRTEVCNGIDDDCSNGVDGPDAANASTYFVDADGDGFGDSGVTQVACVVPPGYVANDQDCDDSSAFNRPGGTELCDTVDNNCNGQVDENAADASIFYYDGDGDGVGTSTNTKVTCVQPQFYVVANGDCNDGNENINPFATEVCDGVDNNCDGITDEDSASGAPLWFRDADRDGYGDATDTMASCSQPSRYVSDNTDCNDQRVDVSPTAPEVCGDGVDNNCDGQVDESTASIGSPTWYVDVDGDGYGDVNEPSLTQCGQPAGYVSDSTDCNDSLGSINPGAAEICDDGIDNNCDGLQDQPATFYLDADGDTFGDPTKPLTVCGAIPNGYVSDASDCNDSNASIHRFGIEVCDSVDNNCNGLIDEGAVDAQNWFADEDDDGYGDPLDFVSACTKPANMIADNTDCDGNNNLVNPGVAEVCGNGIDDNCDGVIDDDGTGSLTWHPDNDGDGYGDSSVSMTACVQPAGAVLDGSDCDDDNFVVNPGRTEICGNSLDDDCSGTVDGSDAINALTWYRDSDSDAYGDPASAQLACTQPAGFILTSGDCDDSNAANRPGGIEVCDNVDNNCNTLIDENAIDMSIWFADMDSDTFGDLGNALWACTQPVNTVVNSLDCNDTRSDIHPNAAEVCADGVDNNCDGLVDDPSSSDALTWNIDRDQDGFGDPMLTTLSCTQPQGYVSNTSDCDDLNNSINPGAAEACNGVDDNCNTQVDEGAVIGSPTWYADVDGDGFGDVLSTRLSCTQPGGYVANSIDCNDSDSGINPAAFEICDDGIDNDCDGAQDTPATYYADNDGDGFGNPLATSVQCGAPVGAFVTNSQDCNDSDATIHPFGVEVCDGADNDCDGTVDQNATDATSWYSDRDLDGFGNAGDLIIACNQPSGYIANADDCNDFRQDISPAAAEMCADGIDNNCDGLVDDPSSSDALVWNEDRDGDGYGTAASQTLSCTQPPGYVSNVSDCDDANALRNPGRTEVCNGIDDDCDGVVDGVNAVNATVWFEDSDGDSFGNAGSSQISCNQPGGYISDSSDCDDGNGLVNPAANEVCDSIDNDCNGLVDDGASDMVAWYDDDDGDSYGDLGNVTLACTQPANTVANSLDCDDQRDDVSPAATEVCGDGIDNDCDGVVDNNGTGALTWFTDNDGDGYGDASASITACSQPVGTVSNSTDCDDNNAVINPGKVEVCNGLDDDCSGVVDGSDAVDANTYYKDGDSDTYGDAGTTLVACLQPAGFVTITLDCNDGNAGINPDAAEVCDNVDNDCDGTTDVGALDASIWYADTDNDTFGDSANTVVACSAPAGYLANSSDCDDNNNTINPTASELCNGVDDNCNGQVDEVGAVDGSNWYFDDDLDGFGDPGNFVIACSQPSNEYVANNLDCIDTRDDVNPSATEVCDGIDNDCDGTTDIGAADAVTWFQDSDSDGFGDASVTQDACSAPVGFVADNSDCNDNVAAINPAATEICADGIDNDCRPSNDLIGSTLYRDADGDGYGSLANPITSCVLVDGYVGVSTDCNDGDASAYPGADEVCDGVDNNCNGLIDDNAIDAITYYADRDLDGFGDPKNVSIVCVQPVDYVTNALDCVDTNDTRYPGAPEFCDGIDTDCNGILDDDYATDATTWYTDRDQDGFGNAAEPTSACAQPLGYVADSSDCADLDSLIRPDATEVCDSIDNNCNGQVDEGTAINALTWYQDSDNDGYGNVSSTQLACNKPLGYVASFTDCNDASAAISPGVAEVCGNNVDDNCNGVIDEGTSTLFLDADGDGYGDAANSIQGCAQSGYVGNSADCNDGNPAINPAATEICDGADNDCDGRTDEGNIGSVFYKDADSDSFGDPNTTITRCTQPVGYVMDSTDCLDTNDSVNTSMTEVCGNYLDDDCNGLADDQPLCDSVYVFDGNGDSVFEQVCLSSSLFSGNTPWSSSDALVQGTNAFNNDLDFTNDLVVTPANGVFCINSMSLAIGDSDFTMFSSLQSDGVNLISSASPGTIVKLDLFSFCTSGLPVAANFCVGTLDPTVFDLGITIEASGNILANGH